MAAHSRLTDLVDSPYMGRAPRVVRGTFAVLAAWLALAAVRNAFFPGFDAGPLFGRYVHDAVLVAAGLLVLARAVIVPGERAAWGFIGAGILAWTFGEIYYTGVLWTVEEVPVPSPADAGYLLMPPLMLVGVLLLLRSRTRAVPLTLLADGLTAALAIAALSAAIVFQTALDAASGDPLGVATTLAYPLSDLILGGFVIGALAGTGWRLDRTWTLLGVGILTFWLADSLYLVQVANGVYESSSWFDAGWWIGLTLVAVAAWQPADGAEAREEGIRLIVMPLSFAVVGLGLLIYGCFAELNVLAVALAAAAMVAVMGRLIFTFRDNVRMLLVSRQEAHHDALTGLLNRRALTRDLAAAIARADHERPVVLVIFDLDGFKLYNDTFGHPAGDALLTRLSLNLADYLDGRGTAYRMGGDEFCALFEPGGPGRGADHPGRRPRALRARRGVLDQQLVRLDRPAAGDRRRRRRAARGRPAHVRQQARQPGVGQPSEQGRAGARAGRAQRRPVQPHARRGGPGRAGGPQAGAQRGRGGQRAPRRRAARRRQGGRARRHPVQAGAAGRGGVRVHPPPHAHRRADHLRRARPQRGRPPGAVEPRALGRRRDTPTAWPARRSRWPRGSCSPPTRSTR